MDDLLIRGVTIPASEVRVRFSRAGGPGGQNVNKRSTRVEVAFDVAGSPSIPPARRALALKRLATRLDSRGVLRVVADDERTQAANRALALQRLQDLLVRALAPPPKPRKKTRPSKAATERRLADKRARGALKRQRSAAGDD